MPGLDGLRALAVGAVVFYHLGFGWASGGLLGVGVFFTLSGYLITDLLLAQRSAGRLRLGSFWLARARRLLPALFLMLIVVTIWVWLADRTQLNLVRDQVGAATVYLSNWWQSFQHLSYFARFGPASPLNHLWSLSVEEQFYVLWPWLLLLGVHFIHERRCPVAVRPRLAAVTLLLALVSAVEMWLVFAPSFDPSRVYYGTDTRAFGLLIGAALAMVWPSRLLTTRIGKHARGIMDSLGLLGLVVIGLLIWRTTQYSSSIYHGGLVLLSVATALTVAALAHPATLLGRALGFSPLRWVGVRSYGIYLWHAPIIILTSPALSTGPNLLRAAFQVAATLAVAALSWRFVEEPIRHGALGRLWAQARSVAWRPSLLPRRVRVPLTATAVACLLVVLALAGVGPPAPVTSLVAAVGAQTDATDAALASGSVLPPPPQPRAAALRSRSSHRAQGARSAPASTSTSASTTATRTTSTSGATTPTNTTTTTSSTTATATLASAAVAAGARPVRQRLRTSCRAVTHIGDSTSEGMVSHDYLPDGSQRLAAQYARVGVRGSHLEITGATSIVETLPGGVDANKVAKRLVSSGYRGCWVIALGTNDSADVYVGSSVSLGQRIDRMMSVIGHHPALWVDAKSRVSNGPYSETNMQRWNTALVQACGRYPNMRVYDWASVVKDRWFIPDGIHYYSPGYAARAHLIADALAKAFPAVGNPPSGCLVHTRSISIPVRGVG
jgi:peptidoglycan/LPS O-acetylase OafA/YrhL